MCTGILSIPVDVFVEKNINEGMYIKRHLANSRHIEADFIAFEMLSLGFNRKPEHSCITFTL